MVRIALSSGHGTKVRGASGFLDEVDEAIKVINATASAIRKLGHEVVTFTDTVSTSQDENLNRIVDWHNAQTRNLDVSCHFNAFEKTGKPMGCECLYVTQQELAKTVADKICGVSGLINRGPKKRTDLFFLNNTDKPAILAEICFVDSSSDTNTYRAKFQSICSAFAEAICGDEAVIGPTPPKPEPEPEPEPPRPQPPSDEHPTIKKGDSNAHVASLQKSLGCLVADGDFGSITDTWVRAFQAACGLKTTGIVDQETWEEVDELDVKVLAGKARLPKPLADKIVAAAKASDLQNFSWPDRGHMPPGYLPGLALSFAYAMRAFEEGDDAATVMSKAQGTSTSKDALAWYEKEFSKLGMSNKKAGLDTLRHLFVMIIGLGPRESSGRYCEGRDLSADNVGSETCEAGLFQTSWNIKAASSAIAPLLNDFWENPNGFLPEFKENVTATANNLNSFGSGDGVRYQWLSRFAPLFHTMVTAVGMRTLGGEDGHWGPIRRREVLLKKEADTLLKAVQDLVEAEEVA